MEREEFNRLIAPHLDELQRAARREVRYRVAMGVRNEARLRRLAPVSLEPDALEPWEDLAAEPVVLTPEEVVAAEEDLRSPRRPEKAMIRVALALLAIPPSEGRIWRIVHAAE